MSNLVVVVFNDETTAFDVRAALAKMQKEYLIQMEDAVVVTRELVLKSLATLGVRITARSAARFVPIAGQAVSAGISFGAMKLVGESHVRDCERVVLSLMEGD